MDKRIVELLSAGATPESIYEEALATVAKMNEDKQKNENLARARGDVIKALDLYGYELVGEHISTEMATELEEALKELEALIPTLTTREKKKPKIEIHADSDAEEKIKEFLKAIGAA